jgi:NAD(P)-dependent dehydrogenase (short-subunit alcohol dehydrogenase family)
MDTTWLGLTGGVAAVTGAGGGIGRGIALHLASVGAKVAVLDRDETGAAAVAREIEAAGGAALALGCDVADRASMEATATRVEAALGPCGLLVNNAAIMRPGALQGLDLDAWNTLLSVNLNGYLITSLAFGAGMIERGAGAIVHVGSIAASHPQAYSGAYSPAKAAVVMLARQMAFEWGPLGIRSNAVSPGMIRTPLTESFYQTPGILERREAVVPSRAIGRPEDIAAVVAFLLSPRAGYVNGQDLTVDGGFCQTLMSHIPRPGYEESEIRGGARG